MKKAWLIALLLASKILVAQNRIISGPMTGHTDLRSTTIWLETSVQTGWTLKYTTANSSKTINPTEIEPVNDHYILKFTVGGLEPGTSYNYSLLNKNKAVASGSLKTQALWQWRKPAPDFSFITGSCAYFNEPVYDRPGKPYGGDSSIFVAMAKEKADFMLWLGDNWYTREVDYYSNWGLNYRASRDRSLKVLQPFLKAMPHYAIWDDHDYSWNNGDKSYPLKEESRKVFMKFWANPSYGENSEGIYSKFTWNDIDVFMLDDRWFRSNDRMKDSLSGQPNEEKRMFGRQQMEWLKNALLNSNENSNISFRIIATGSQVLNPLSPYDCLRHFPAEFNELLNFIKENNINGVVFLTGDRHISEIIKTERPGSYPLYDITSSPLTSGSARLDGPEANNPYRILGQIAEQNYTRISFSGNKPERKMTVEFLNVKGEKLADWSVMLKDISIKK
ncbi:MAG: phosphodiesterase [Chitinophagaceae bacterium]